MLLPVCRKTGIEYSALLPLQKQFGLSSLVGGMLTASNSLALAANQNRVACACDTQGRVLLGLVDFYITGLIFDSEVLLLPSLVFSHPKQNSTQFGHMSCGVMKVLGDLLFGHFERMFYRCSAFQPLIESCHEK